MMQTPKISSDQNRESRERSRFDISSSKLEIVSNFDIRYSSFRRRRLDFDIRHSTFHGARRAFSLTEILIVVALIVVLIALAVPAFNFLSGSRSVDAAQNTISALLGRARTEAIGLQEVRGVFFYLDRSTDRVTAALVRQVESPDTGAGGDFAAVVQPPPEVFLDLVESESVTLPSGVGLQVIDDARVNTSGIRVDDGYVGFNVKNDGNGIGAGSSNPTRTWYGGVILFDGSGRLISRRYAFKTFRPTATGREATRMGDLLYRPSGVINPLDHAFSPFVRDVVPLAEPSGTSYYPKSQVGLVLFDKNAFRGAFPNTGSPPYETEWDWQLDPATGTYIARESAKEQWLDENALSLLVNRYNGTLVKGE